MSRPVKEYPAGNDSRAGAADRSRAHKHRELMRRGASDSEASKHAGNLVAKQSTGDPNGTPSF